MHGPDYFRYAKVLSELDGEVERESLANATDKYID